MKANESQIGGKHYKSDYEHWDLAITIPLGYLEGCATKYVSRWRKKGGISDLKKALHYLDKLIETTDYEVYRKLQIPEIILEIDRFAQANHLDDLEEEFILMIGIYGNIFDLEAARQVLEEIIENEEAGLIKHIDEPNYPGTPDDGGHHARMEDDNA